MVIKEIPPPQRQGPQPTLGGGRASITHLLAAWRQGRSEASNQLMERIYPQLRAMAAARVPRDGRTWTLHPTEVVHEAYFKLLQQSSVGWRNQAQFFKVAARILRRVILDHARHRSRQKRGGNWARQSLSQIPELVEAGDRWHLDELLRDLAHIEARAAQVVELRVFCGLRVEEAAALLEVSPRTVARDWRFARAWLRHQLKSDSELAGSETSTPQHKGNHS